MKAKILILITSILIISILQSTILDYIRIYNVKPNLFLIFIVSVALLNGNVEGAITGFFCGLAQDMASGKILGFYALLGLYLGLVTGSVNRRLYRENILVIVFFTFISTAAYEWSVYFLNTFMHSKVQFLFPLKNVILPEAIYNSVLSIFVYIIVIKLNDKIGEMDRLSRKY